jgi:hypothetical protein
MRAHSSAHALGLLFVFPVACAVYQDDALKPIDGAVTSGGSSAGSQAGSEAGHNNVAGSSAGTTSTAKGGGGAGGAAAVGGSNPSGGSLGTEGGDSAGGDANEPNPGGTGGSTGGGGAGGKGGTGGTSAGMGGGGAGGGGAGHGGAAGSGGGGSGGMSGSAGTGGGPGNQPKCSDHPLTQRTTWTASASHYDSKNSGVPANLLDNAITRWSTGKAQSGDEWLQLDFGSKVTINHVNLQQGDDTNDYPRAYQVIVSDTAKDLNGTVLLSGAGKTGVSTPITLPALASGRYLLIKQTGSSLSWWSAEEIEVSCAE